MVVDQEDLSKLLHSRYQPVCDLPLEFTQLLDKLVDVPTTHATPVERNKRNATGESYEGIQPHQLRHRRA